MGISKDKAACGSFNKRLQENLDELCECTFVTSELLEYLFLDQLISTDEKEDLMDTTITNHERVLRLYTEFAGKWDDSGFEKFSKALFLGGNKMASNILTQKAGNDIESASNDVRNLEKHISTILNPLCPTSGCITTSFHPEMKKGNNKTCKDLEVFEHKLGLLYSLQTESDDTVPPAVKQFEETLSEADLDLAVMLNNLGVLCAEDGKREDAVELYREALRIQGGGEEDPSGRMIRGNISSLKVQRLGRCKDVGSGVKSNKLTHRDRRERQIIVNKEKSLSNGKHEGKNPWKRGKVDKVLGFLLSL